MKRRQLTVGELVDYLGQFPVESPVYLNAEDIPEMGDGIALDVLDYQVDIEPVNVYSRREHRSA
jgi:hypothetical protein